MDKKCACGLTDWEQSQNERQSKVKSPYLNQDIVQQQDCDAIKAHQEEEVQSRVSLQLWWRSTQFVFTFLNKQKRLSQESQHSDHQSGPLNFDTQTKPQKSQEDRSSQKSDFIEDSGWW